jgi:hypothetical protein
VAYRVLRVTNIREILRRWLKRKTERKIAAGLADRKTVRRYIAAAQAQGLDVGDDVSALTDALIAAVTAAVRPGAPPDRGDSWALCMKHRDLLAGWRDEGAPGPKLRTLLLRHSGQAAALRTVQRFVAEELGGAKKPGTTVHIASCAPGEELQVDFEELGWVDDAEAGRRRKLHAFVCVSVHSRLLFIYPTWNETQVTTIEALDAAWAFFGGVFEAIIPDNLKAVVTRPDPVNPLFSDEFLEYSQSRDFIIGPARVRKPQDKGIVENGNKFTQGDFFAGERHSTLADWREWGVRWSRAVGLRKHGTTKHKPLEVFERDERPVLKPAPQTPWDIPSWQGAKVGRDHRIQVKAAFYQLPSGHAGQVMRVRVDRATIKVWHKGALLRAFPRVEPGQSGGDVQDIPAHLRALAQRDRVALAQEAAGHGTHVGEVARRLMERQPFFSQARKVHRLLKLCREFGDAATDAACKKALDFDVDDVVRIERVLAQALETKQVQPAVVLRLPKPRFARDPETFRVRPTGS